MSNVSATEEAFRRINPVEYYRKFVSQDVRPDGRRLLDMRNPHVQTGPITTADGSAVARIGRTAVMAAVHLEVTSPGIHSPNLGDIDIKISLWPLCSPDKYTIGSAPDESFALSNFLFRTITTSGVIDMSSLCIKKGELVWTVRCDVLVLDNDGICTRPRC